MCRTLSVATSMRWCHNTTTSWLTYREQGRRFSNPREVEVGQLRHWGHFAAEKHVGRLEITMDNAFSVKILQSGVSHIHEMTAE